MTAHIIDGKRIAQNIHNQQRTQALQIAEKLNRKPHLSVVLVGDNHASISYVSAKERACNSIGLDCRIVRLSTTIKQSELIANLQQMNDDNAVDGIIVQLPLPEHIDTDAVIASVAPQKDVDGLHPYNLGMLLAGQPTFIPATPAGVHRMLIDEKIQIKGKRVTIVGRSRLVGMPLAVLLSNRHENATVTVCHSHTANLHQHTRAANIIIAATGQPNLINATDVNKDTVVIDVGINRIPSQTTKSGFKLVGDVNFDEVSQVARAITPVPGGVGPMTIAMLLENVLLATKRELIQHDQLI